MDFPWLLWIVGSLAAWAAAREVSRAGKGGGWRTAGRLAWLAAAVVFLAPVEAWAAHHFISWLYETPLSFAGRLLRSRHVLPLAFYQAKGARGLRLLVVGSLMLTLGLAVAARWQRGGWGARGRGWLRRPVGRAAAVALLVALSAPLLYTAWLSVQMHRPHPVFYTDCHKVWKHHRDSLAEAVAAFDHGAPGIEIDILYDKAQRRYVIGRYDVALPPVPLEKVFAAVGSRGYFWLDTKTIHYLSPAEAQQAAADMKALLSRFHLLHRAIVESDAPQNLRYFAAQGIYTSYWIFDIDESAFPKTPWARWWALTRIQRNYSRGNFAAISLDQRFYTPMVRWMLKGARIHIFTVNDEGRIRNLVHQEAIRVVLTDTDFYDITDCP